MLAYITNKASVAHGIAHITEHDQTPTRIRPEDNGQDTTGTLTQNTTNTPTGIRPRHDWDTDRNTTDISPGMRL